jgi:hypothetical protein
MSLASRYIGRYFGLPAPRTRDVTVERDIDIVTRDGVALRTDHYAPSRNMAPRGKRYSSALNNAPTILVRTPYGRKGVFGLITGRVFAEQGFHVVLQSCRGTFDSGGKFEPMRHERDDGLDTVAWIGQQDWFDGNLFTHGASYIGFTQWAIATDTSARLTGMLAAVTASSFRGPTYAGGSFSLDTVLNWATLLNNQGGSVIGFIAKQRRSQSMLRRAWTHLPLSEADAIAVGREISFFQEWLINAADEPYWRDRGHGGRVEDVDAAVCLVGGWYDIFLPWQLADYARMRAAGKWPRLVIGDWTHASRGLFAHSMSEGVSWFRAQLDDQSPESSAARPGVKVYVIGANEWRTLDDWPPPGRTREWSIRPGGSLTAPDPTAAPKADAAVDRFRYDPADPTPSPGGALLTFAAGRVVNNRVEARDDVLVYSSPVLTAPVEAVGPVSVTVQVRSSCAEFDLFARLCDVAPNGRSWNVCDGLTRVSGGPVAADGTRTIDIELWPTAYRWRAGHRLRLQIAGGAHPRYARNPGTGDALGAATRLVAVDHEVAGGVLRLLEPI